MKNRSNKKMGVAARLGAMKSSETRRKMLFGTAAVATFGFSAWTLNAMLFPTVPSQALSAGSEVGVKVKEFIKLALDTSALALKDSNNNTVIAPSAAGTEITGDVNVAVTTNTLKGYSLSVYTDDNSTSMTHENSGVEDVISSISTAAGYNAETGLSALSADTWGLRKYNSSTSSYSNWFGVGANSVSGTVIASTDSDDADYCENLAYPLENTGCDSGSYDTYQVGFGAKVTSALAAGTYKNTVTFSAVAKSEGAPYTLKFGANGGSDTMGTRTIIAGSNIVMPKNGFTKEGYAIKGWALTDGQTTATYAAGETVAVDTLVAAAIAAGQDTSSTAELTIYAVWDIAYAINFKSGNSSATGSMSNIDAILSDEVEMPESGYALEGYNFVGWALKNGESTAPYTAGNKVKISDLITAARAAGQDVSSSTAGAIILYGVWEEAVQYMQKFDCSTLTKGQTVELVDKRDEAPYLVKKLEDNNCWMVSNLTLGSKGIVKMTPDDTHITDGNTYYLPAAGTRGSLANGTSQGTPTFDSNNDDQAQVQYKAAGTTDNQTKNPVPENTGYYNFYAATLGYSHYYSSGSGTGISQGSSSQDICPAGWRLPWTSDAGTTRQGNAEFYKLALSYNSNSSVWTNYIAPGSTSTSSPYSSNSDVRTGMIEGDKKDTSHGYAGFSFAGYYYSGALYYVGTDGSYWSSSVYSTGSGYYLSFGTTNVFPQGNYYKYNGFAVRCIAGV